MASSVFSLTHFKEERIETKQSGISIENAYSSIPRHIFNDPSWFFDKQKDTQSNLEMLLLGESYRVAWSRDQNQYLLFTKTVDPTSVIMIDSSTVNQASLINRATQLSPLPRSDDEEDDKDKSINYSMICSRYLTPIKSWLEEAINPKPVLPVYSENVSK